MKNLIHLTAILCLIGLFACGNQDKAAQAKASLEYIDLLRGDIILCSGKAFGEEFKKIRTS